MTTWHVFLTKRHLRMCGMVPYYISEHTETHMIICAVYVLPHMVDRYRVGRRSFSY